MSENTSASAHREQQAGITATELARFRASVAGAVFTQADPGWDAARAAWNLNADQRPALVVEPAGPRDIQAVVRLAADHALGVATQARGHGATGTVRPDVVLVNSRRLTDVTINPAARLARVEGGARWLHVVPAAAEHGLAGLAGSTPDVGVAGYSLGGGLGWLGRRYGLAANSIVAAELVTAAGEHVRVDAGHDPDLFWALRGGGGNFGIVTALEFSLYPVRSVYAGASIWPVAQAGAVLRRYRDWAATAPDELTATAMLIQFPPLPEVPEPLRGQAAVYVGAAVVGDEATGQRLLRPVTELPGPLLTTFTQMPAAQLGTVHMDPETPSPTMGDNRLLTGLPDEVIDAVIEAAAFGPGSPLALVEFRQLGGALARTGPDHGALDRLEGQFLAYGLGLPFAPDAAGRIDEALARVINAVAPAANGHRYLNFYDRPADTRPGFSSYAYGRLTRLRSAYDPVGLFRANLTIPRSAA
jgi:FAD binding domain